jgi:hypothetical protein
MLQMRKEKEEKLQSLLVDGITSGELREHDPYVMALMISGVIGSIWAPLVLDEWDIGAAPLAEMLVDNIMNGIKNMA